MVIQEIPSKFFFFIYRKLFFYRNHDMYQTKQNSSRMAFQSKQRRSLKNLYDSNNFYSTTQTLFPSKKNSMKHNEGEFMQLTKADFYKTIANSTSWGGWVRPQSKQGCRKILSRPETSKGFRKQPGKNMVFSNIQNERFMDSKIKTMMNSKRKSKQTQKQEMNEFYSQNNKWDQRAKNQEIQNRRYEEFGEVEIVINRRNCDSAKKSPSIHKNKFETDLDDEFLELFAD